MFVFVFKCISRLILLCFIQPPLWERYQQQVKEWALALTKNNTNVPNGCQEKAAPIEKLPMFAFCLKPWGLEVPNKGSKQRSHRKFSVSGQSNAILGDQDGFHAFGIFFYTSTYILYYLDSFFLVTFSLI